MAEFKAFEQGRKATVDEVPGVRVFIFDRFRDVRAYMDRDGRPLTRLPRGEGGEGAVWEGGNPTGTVLPWMAIDAYAESLASDAPPEFVVVGETRDEVRGRVWADVAVNPAYIEATTDFRRVEGRGWSYVCPQCDRVGGGHERSCELAGS